MKSPWELILAPSSQTDSRTRIEEFPDDFQREIPRYTEWPIPKYSLLEITVFTVHAKVFTVNSYGMLYSMKS